MFSFSYLLPSALTLSLTFSWYSINGFNFSRELFPSSNRALPKADVKHKVPDYMWDIYKNGVENSPLIDVVKGIFPQYIGVLLRNRFYPNQRHYKINFITPESAPTETLLEAEIRIAVDKTSIHATFHMYRKDDLGWKLFTKLHQNPQTKWMSFNVTSWILQLENSPDETITLLVVVTTHRKNENLNANRLQPILLLSYATKKFKNLKSLNQLNKTVLSRKKRNANFEGYEEESNRIWESGEFSETGRMKRLRNSCRRKPLYVDFSKINYDAWIVAPSGYEAFQCVGKCYFPVSEHLSPTKHAVIQTLVHTVSPHKAARACCVPIRLDPISILYVDERGILTYRFSYKDMVVAECGCR